MKIIDSFEHSGIISRRNFLGITVMGLLAACSPKRQAEVNSADTPSIPTTSPTKEPTPIVDLSWSDIASMPDPHRNLKATATADKIYAAGGYDAAGNFANSNFEYDPASDTWQVRASLPTARSNLAMAAVADIVYAIGGDPFQDTNKSYDPDTDAWTTLAPIPTPRQHINCAALDGKLYVIGGLSRQGVSDKNEVYDPEFGHLGRTVSPAQTQAGLWCCGSEWESLCIRRREGGGYSSNR